jgi:hypothetical protein
MCSCAKPRCVSARSICSLAESAGRQGTPGSLSQSPGIPRLVLDARPAPLLAALCRPVATPMCPPAWPSALSALRPLLPLAQAEPPFGSCPALGWPSLAPPALLPPWLRHPRLLQLLGLAHPLGGPLRTITSAPFWSSVGPMADGIPVPVVAMLPSFCVCLPHYSCAPPSYREHALVFTQRRRTVALANAYFLQGRLIPSFLVQSR